MEIKETKEITPKDLAIFLGVEKEYNDALIEEIINNSLLSIEDEKNNVID